MELKKEICKAFCDSVEVTPFHGGLAVGTSWKHHFGDRIGMYVLPQNDGSYRIIDNALTVALLENQGVNLDNSSKHAAFVSLLNLYDASYDEELGELFREVESYTSLPNSLLEFSSLLLRMNDLLFLTRERVENTFKEEVKKALFAELGDKVRIMENEPVSHKLSEVLPDYVFYPQNRDPVALFLVNSDVRLLQAIHLRMVADYEVKSSVSIVAMLESDKAVSQKTRVMADNRLDAVPRYSQGKKDAIHRISTEVLGRQSIALH